MAKDCDILSLRYTYNVGRERGCYIWHGGMHKLDIVYSLLNVGTAGNMYNGYKLAYSVKIYVEPDYYKWCRGLKGNYEIGQSDEM